MTDPVETWQTGNIEAFETFFRQYERLVFSSAYLFLGKKEEAEDVLQEVFISVWKSRSTFDPAKVRSLPGCIASLSMSVSGIAGSRGRGSFLGWYRFAGNARCVRE